MQHHAEAKTEVIEALITRAGEAQGGGNEAATPEGR
jgi:hypothetical protein